MHDLIVVMSVKEKIKAFTPTYIRAEQDHVSVNNSVVANIRGANRFTFS